MKTAAVTELKNRLSHFLRIVARGETVTVLDRGRPVAQISPVPKLDEHLQRLAAEGLVRLPLQPLPRDFLKRSLPKCSRPLSDAVIEDREDRV